MRTREDRGVGTVEDEIAPPHGLPHEAPAAFGAHEDERSSRLAGATVALWTITDGEHVPNVTSAYLEAVADFFLAHPK